MLELVITKRTDKRLLDLMAIHYSQPKGFVGRNICYAIFYNGIYYGHIVAGSATKFLPGRKDEIGEVKLNNIVNNIFYHIEPVDGKYPTRNFSTLVIKEFEKQSVVDWKVKYGDDVVAFETLIELPRTGECYRRAKWKMVGQTKGYTCKRIAGKGTDNWSGKRVWNTENLRPKLVFVKKVSDV
jgi:hypothetical protein